MFKKYKIKVKYSGSSRAGKSIKSWGYLAVILIAIALVWTGYFTYQNYYKTGKIKLNSKVTGTILYKNEPLYGALASIENGLSVSTDEKGFFEIPKVKFGKVKIKFSRDGFISQEKEVFVWRQNTTVEKVSLKRVGELDSSYSGRVFNGFDKKPIVGAIINLGDSSAISDDSGNFSFSDMPKGELTLKISALGFYDLEEPVYLDPENKQNKEYGLTPYGRISFTSARSGKRDIYSINYDGKNLSNLTQKYKGDCWSATFTTDGKKFVFFSDMAGIYDEWGQKQSDLYVANRYGEGAKKINKNGVIPEEKYVISRDGKVVIFFGRQKETDKREIYLAGLEEKGGWVQLTDNDLDESDIAVSGDGKTVAYEVVNGEKREIALLNVDNLDVKAISSDSSREDFMTFLDDGKKLLYSRQSIDFGARVFIYDLVKGKEEEIFKTYSDISNLALSNDGSKIIFTSRRDGKNGIYSFEIDGEHEVQVYNKDEEYGNMTWPQKDGLLVFTITSGEVNKLAVMNLSNRSVNEIEDVGDDWISWVYENFDKEAN